MNVFQPMQALSLEANGSYTLLSTTPGPNSCVKAGEVVFDPPEDQSVSKSSFPVTLNIEQLHGQVCLQVLTPVFHMVPGIQKSGGVKTINKTSIAGAIIIEEQIQTYETCLLEGNAW